MKKLITLCFFTMALLLGTQSISAQEVLESPEVIAKEKTFKLTQEFGLDKTQSEIVWRAFLGREKAKQEISQGSFSEAEIKNINSKADKNFYTLMENALNDQQIMKFKTISKEYL